MTPDPTPPADENALGPDPAFAVRLYEELRNLAGRALGRQQARHTLQPTALVHEAYLKLADAPQVPRERSHFLALAAKVMRQVLIDHARSKSAQKRGGDWQRITLREGTGASSEPEVDLLALDEALDELSRLNERKARLVELRFFAGLTETEAAESLGISRTEASREWRLAKAWLSHRLKADEDAS